MVRIGFVEWQSQETGDEFRATHDNARRVRGIGRRRHRDAASNGQPDRSRWWCPTAPAASPIRWRALTADRLTKTLGQTFVIENKVGAGGAIGIDYALSLPRDGYTILFVGSTLFTVLPLAQKVNYEPLKDLVPVSITGTNGMVMVVPKDLPFKTLKEFVDYARRTPARSPIRAADRPPTTTWRPLISPARKSSTWCMCRSRAASPR